MPKEPMKDRILSLGRRLEKSGPKSLEIRLSGGNLALFRSHGLQVLSTEAEEMDTNGSCLLVITPMAGAISGLLINIMNILTKGGGNEARADFAIERFKQVLSSRRTRPAGTWEGEAMKAIVSAALESAEKSFPPRPTVDENPMDDFDPFAEIEQHASKYWRHAKIHIRNADGELARIRRMHHLEQPPLKTANAATPTWRRVGGIDGVEIAGYWIPVLTSSAKVDDLTISKVLKRLTRLNLKPEIAMAALADKKGAKKRRDR